MHTLNNGTKPTFIRGQSRSIIDVTFASSRLLDRLNEWSVLNMETLTEHQYIMYLLQNKLPVAQCSNPTRRWNVKKMKIDVLAIALAKDEISEDEDADLMARRLDRVLETACRAAVPEIRRTHNRRSVYWWSDEVARARQATIRARRAVTRSRTASSVQEDVEPLLTAYKQARKNLRNEIFHSKEQCWKQLCKEIDNDPWGLPYRIVLKKSRS